MALLIIFTIAGMFLGELIFSDSGWLIGGVLGFLITKITRMTYQINRMERDLKLLHEQKTSIAVLPQQPQPQAASIPESASTPEEKPIPLAERLKAHGIDLPPAEITNINDIAPAPDEWTAETSSLQPGQIAQKMQMFKQDKPAQPNLFEKAIDYVRHFFTEGNPIVRIGMVVMFFGLSFLVKYASNQGLLPLELRMAAVAVIAIILIGLGWKTRTREGGYGLVLQGGGIAALYLTVFAAAKMYSLMPGSVALGVMFIIVVFGTALAILQNAQVLALMATTGGFLAPILTSDGSGNHIGLFSFYLLLNIGILAIAWFKSWRLLNWIGFVFTFVITSLWGVLKYEPHLYASTQPFLLAFFSLYLIVSILFSLKQPPDLKGLVDGSLVFGLPIVGFGLQTALLKHTEFGLAISALILAAVYILIARLLWATYLYTHRVLIESFIALGVCFATLSIPLALDAQWTSATWAMEASGLIWIGLRQCRLLPRLAGYSLHIAAAFSLTIHGIEAGDLPVLRGDFIGLIILSISALCIAYLIYQYAGKLHNREKKLAVIAHTLGWLWWLTAGYLEINAHVSGENHFSSLIIFFALSVAILSIISQKIRWPMLGNVGYWMLPLTALLAMHFFGEGLFIGYAVYPSQGGNLLALAIFFVIQYRFLWWQREQGAQGLLSVYHILSAWFLFSLCYWEALHWQDYFQWYGTGAAVLWFACLVIPLVALLYFSQKSFWPFNVYPADYKNLIPAPLLFLLLCWFLYASRYSGVTDQFYLPLLNPLDLAQAAVLLIFSYAVKRGFIGLGATPASFRYGSLGLLGFIWLNVVLLRALHHYTGTSYAATPLWDSTVVQMSLSILWAMCALAVMNISRRLQVRELWLVGAGLLGLVLLKLFTKDLTGTGTLARIISFMVVGGLMLLIGYLSPIPAKAKSIAEQNV
jgi:uncharacterized membrane protein